MEVEFAENQRYVEYEGLLMSLHSLTASGPSDTDAAEAVRDSMDASWSSLTPEERARIKGLSADLYMLDEEEIAQPGEAPPLEAEARSLLETAHARGDWGQVLHVLRQAPFYFPPVQRAAIRARAFEELNHYEAALQFARYAVRAEPNSWPYVTCLVRILLRAGRFDEALQEASHFTSVYKDPIGTAAVSSVLYNIGRQQYPDRLTEIYIWMIDAMRRQTAAASSHAKRRTLADFAFVLQGIAHEGLGQTRQALEAYDEFLKKHPHHDKVLIARGLLRSELGEERAVDDFEQAVTLGTESYVPYVYLAQAAMRRGKYQEAIRHAEAVIQRGARPPTLALVYSWLAIAHFQTGSAHRRVESHLQTAIGLDPVSEQVHQTAFHLTALMAAATRRKPVSGEEYPMPIGDISLSRDFDPASSFAVPA